MKATYYCKPYEPRELEVVELNDKDNTVNLANHDGSLFVGGCPIVDDANAESHGVAVITDKSNPPGKEKPAKHAPEKAETK